MNNDKRVLKFHHHSQIDTTLIQSWRTFSMRNQTQQYGHTSLEYCSILCCFNHSIPTTFGPDLGHTYGMVSLLISLKFDMYLKVTVLTKLPWFRTVVSTTSSVSWICFNMLIAYRKSPGLFSILNILNSTCWWHPLSTHGIPSQNWTPYNVQMVSRQYWWYLPYWTSSTALYRRSQRWLLLYQSYVPYFLTILKTSTHRCYFF